MKLRLITSIIGIPILLFAIWSGFPWFAIILAPICLLGLKEFYSLAKHNGARPSYIIGIILVVGFLANASISGQKALLFTGPIAAVSVLVLLICWVLQERSSDTISDVAYTLIGPIYTAWLLSHAILLRHAESGWQWLFLALLATFATDTGAFLTGSIFGRTPLATNISPRKTREGAIGGLLIGTTATVALGTVLGLPISLLEGIFLGLLLSVLAQLGDLLESAMKRSFGVKQTGKVLPGHGGILDRIDSIVFTIPFTYYALIGAGRI